MTLATQFGFMDSVWLAIFMYSIRLRLIVLFIVLTTSVLATFAVYAQFQLADELESRFQHLQKETMQRLTAVTPQSLWDLSVDNARSVIAAEMLPLEVSSIQILDDKQRLFAGAIEDDRGELIGITSAQDVQGIRVEANLYATPLSEAAVTPDRRLLGKVVVYFSRDRIDAALRSAMWHRAGEIFLIDLVLLFALILSLRMVFRPLAELRDALFGLARQEMSEVAELPETQRNEFGEVIRGFNQTQRRLKEVMERRRQAEEEARMAALKSEAAYINLQSMQASLLQSEKLASLGSLVAGVAHEINTPVGITLTSASVLHDVTVQLRQSMRDGPLRKSDIVAYMDTAEQSAQLIMSNSERAALLIQNFKHVAADRTSEFRREYELKAYIQEVMSSLNPKLRMAKVQVSLDFPQPIKLDGYPGLMAQVLTNLTMNALAHAFQDNQGGHIKIAAQLEEDKVSMAFSDDGCGIAAEHIGKIFDPFFTTRRGQGGTGLGLNIVHNIITKQFAGTVEVRSGPGGGSCFVLRFPRVSPQSLTV